MKSHITKSRSYQAKGFTLVELLVTMAIIAVLAGLASTWAFKAYKRSKISAKTVQYRQLYIANDSYVAEHGGAICPAKNGSTLWTNLLAPYITSEKNRAYVDPFFKKYNKKKAFITGIGMAYKHKLPESNDQNIIWDENDTEGKIISMSEITYTGTRILMGDSSNWFLNDKKVDATRHEENEDGKDVKKGMFLLFDGNVVFYTAKEAKLGLTDPEKLEE